jgi:predicted enzyme related to lactoylglutathione lyase
MQVMKKTLLLLPLCCSLSAMGQKATNTKYMSEQQKEKQAPQIDTTAKVTGIGGVFFFAENPEATRSWYQQNLGIESSPYGASFESRDLAHPEQINTLQWCPFKQGSTYFAPSKKEFMINYRVQNIEALVQKLKANGATILDNIEASDYGKFVHIIDPEGNKIELWEPVVETKAVH